MFAFALSVSCSDRTVIVVDLRAEGLRVPEDIDRVEIDVMSESGSRAMGSFAIASLPQSLAVRPEGGMRGAIEVRARAFHGAEWLVQRVQMARFVDGMSARVDISFERSCRGIVCDSDCSNGRCVGGPPRDAMTVDASDSSMDAAQDVGMDTSQEVAADAPLDRGTEPSTDAALDRTGLVINEVDYDQAGEDTAEFIEIYNAAATSRVLDGLVVFAINGSDGLPYANWVLSGPLAPGAFVLIYGPSISPPIGVSGIPMFQASVLQNSNEGIALFDTRNTMPVDSLAYNLVGGTTLRATIQGTSFEMVEGSRATARDSGTQVRSMVRLPNGMDTNNASVDWLESGNPTPGTANIP